MDVPALSLPVGALLVRRLDGEPVQVTSFVDLDVLDEGLNLLCEREDVGQDLKRYLFHSLGNFPRAHLIRTQCTSLSRACHASLSRGPALTVSRGIFCTVARVDGSQDSAMLGG